MKQKVYRQIFERIIHNEFPLDEFLVEGKLAEMFGVSRAPVREALVELCNEKILRNIPRAGYQIVQLSQKLLRDAIQLRLLLETEAVKLACSRLNAERRARLERVKQELHKLEGSRSISLEEWIHTGSHLHLTIGELSGNQLLCEKIKETHDLIRRAMVQIYLDQEYPRRQQPLLHGRIIDAMIEGDTATAVDLLQKDISTLRDILREA